MERTKKLAIFGGAWLAFETFNRVCTLRKLGVGLKIPAFFLLTAGWGGVIQAFGTNNQNGPLICAYFKKYEHLAKENLFDIRDEKREWFDIDTSDYLKYSFDDLHHAHAHHGPQPDDMVLNNSWLVEMDKYLRGEENNFKSHPKYLQYNFEFTDKGKWPSEEEITQVFSAPSTDQKTPDSLKKKKW